MTERMSFLDWVDSLQIHELSIYAELLEGYQGEGGDHWSGFIPPEMEPEEDMSLATMGALIKARIEEENKNK